VRALGAAGREEALVRQTLYRMEHEEELITRRAGRMKFYRPSPYALAEIEAGKQKIFAPVASEWDGRETNLEFIEAIADRLEARAKDGEVIDALVNELKADCNRYTNGQCQTVACLKRGGYKKGGPQPNYEIATCDRYEQVQALDRASASSGEGRG
jgi:hypothetical protein